MTPLSWHRNNAPHGGLRLLPIKRNVPTIPSSYCRRCCNVGSAAHDGARTPALDNICPILLSNKPLTMIHAESLELMLPKKKVCVPSDCLGHVFRIAEQHDLCLRQYPVQPRTGNIFESKQDTQEIPVILRTSDSIIWHEPATMLSAGHDPLIMLSSLEQGGRNSAEDSQQLTIRPHIVVLGK